MGHKRSRSSSPAPSDTPSSPSRSQSQSQSQPDTNVKIIHLDNKAPLSAQPPKMKCTLPPHPPLSFQTYEAYTTHYAQQHTHRCTTCSKNFPDDHYLSLHIAEHHDPFKDAARDRGDKTYACLVASCDRLCSTPQKRRLHCIDKHGFPKNFDFWVIKDGIDRRGSLLRRERPAGRERRRSSVLSAGGENAEDGGMEGIKESTEVKKVDEKKEVKGEKIDDVKGEEQSHEVEMNEDGKEAGGDEKEDEAPTSPRAPVKLHGRGGFQHPRGFGRGRGRGREMSNPVVPATATAAPSQTPKTQPEAKADPMEGLTSSMSSLQFIPHALRNARGKGRGRGNGV